MKSILFVCTGNMCRSPFAEHLFRTLAPDGVEICSAGLTALPGGKVPALPITAARRFGVDLSAHSTRSLDEVIVQRASEVYVFERFHRENLEALFPDAAVKVRLLGSLIGALDAEIADPLGAKLEDIARCYETIHRACVELRRRIPQSKPLIP